jgi:hypothetical protein
MMIMKQSRNWAGRVAFAFFPLFVLNAFGAEYPHFFFAEEPVNPRKTAMGGVGAALDGGGFSFYNPASISLAASPFIALEFGRQGGDLSKSVIETAWMFPSWFAGVSFPVQSTDWQIGTEQGVGAMSSNQMFGPTVAGGYRRGRFATGHALTWLSERIGEYTIDAVTYSTGVTYRIIPGSLVAGASLFHYVRFDSMRTPWTRAPRGWYRDAAGLPRMVRAGVAWTDTLVSDVPVTFAADLLYRDFDSLIVPLGAEVWILPSIAARMGMRLFDRRGDLFHVGCGIHWSSLNFDFDYGFARPPVKDAALEPKWLFGLTYSIPSRKSVARDKPDAPAAQKVPAVEETVPISGQKPGVMPADSLSPSGPATVPTPSPDTATSAVPVDTAQSMENVPVPMPEAPADSLPVPDGGTGPAAEEE